MPEPANIQVRDALKAQLEANGASVIVERDTDASPIQPEERPCRVVRITDVVLDEKQEMGFGAQLHTATVAIDHYEDTDSTGDLNEQLSAAVADSVALIGVDQTLGNRCFSQTFVSADASSDNVPDAGCATLTLELQYLTKLFDWTTIVF